MGTFFESQNYYLTLLLTKIIKVDSTHTKKQQKKKLLKLNLLNLFLRFERR